jgi:hypothetical protein
MPLTDPQVIEEIRLYAPHAHDAATRESWAEIDSYYKRESEIKFPEAVEGETGDAASLRRLLVHTNFCKTVVNSTVTMAMASGIKAVALAEDGEGELEDKVAARVFNVTDVRRLLRYASRHGAAWLQVLESDRVKPYRVHKAEVARRIMMTEDPERERGVLVMQTFERRQPMVEGGLKERYYVARWYEWSDDRSVVGRRDFVSVGSADNWQRRRLENGAWQASFPYMPWVYVPNREEDSIPEQSDVLDGLEVFKQYDALRVKFLKALEDESFRQIFLANVGEEAAKNILAAGGVNVWYAKNRAGEAPPEMQVAAPADQRQFLEGLKDLVDSLATVTRTSVLELNERPVQDIPAQTLRVLYGPQIERVTETTEHVNPALSLAASIILKKQVRLTLKPRLPISEDKEHQNKKGLLDSNAYSIRQMLMDSGFTREQAEEIFAMRLEELRRINEVEVAKEEQLIDAEGEKAVEVARARPASRPAA